MNSLKNSTVNSVLLTFVLALFFTFGFATMNSIAPNVHNEGFNITAHAAKSPGEALNELNNNKGGVLGSDVKNKVMGISTDIQEIVLVVVLAILTVSTTWTAIKFNGAGDNAQAKTTLKNALIFQVLGIVFIASAYGLVKFGIANLNIF